MAVIWISCARSYWNLLSQHNYIKNDDLLTDNLPFSWCPDKIFGKPSTLD